MCDVEESGHLLRAEKAMSLFSLITCAIPLTVIAIWKDWKFTRSRFVLVICTTSFLIALLWVVATFHEGDAHFTGKLTCFWRATRELFVWLLLTELTAIIWFTIYSVNILAPISRHLEAAMHLGCVLVAFLVFGLSFGLCKKRGCYTEDWPTQLIVDCLDLAIRFSYARNLYMFFPLVLYCWMLYRIHTQRAVLKQAEEQLQTFQHLPRPEKLRNKKMIELRKDIIRGVYQPLRVYPLFFVLLLVSDLIKYFALKHDTLQSMCAAYEYTETHLEVAHTVWITFNGLGILIVFFFDPLNRQRLTPSSLRKRFKSIKGRRVRIALTENQEHTVTAWSTDTKHSDLHAPLLADDRDPVKVAPSRKRMNTGFVRKRYSDNFDDLEEGDEGEGADYEAQWGEVEDTQHQHEHVNGGSATTGRAVRFADEGNDNDGGPGDGGDGVVDAGVSFQIGGGKRRQKRNSGAGGGDSSSGGNGQGGEERAQHARAGAEGGEGEDSRDVDALLSAYDYENIVTYEDLLRVQEYEEMMKRNTPAPHHKRRQTTPVGQTQPYKARPDGVGGDGGSDVAPSKGTSQAGQRRSKAQSVSFGDLSARASEEAADASASQPPHEQQQQQQQQQQQRQQQQQQAQQEQQRREGNSGDGHAKQAGKPGKKTKKAGRRDGEKRKSQEWKTEAFDRQEDAVLVSLPKPGAEGFLPPRRDSIITRKSHIMRDSSHDGDTTPAQPSAATETAEAPVSLQERVEKEEENKGGDGGEARLPSPPGTPPPIPSDDDDDNDGNGGDGDGCSDTAAVAGEDEAEGRPTTSGSLEQSVYYDASSSLASSLQSPARTGDGHGNDHDNDAHEDNGEDDDEFKTALTVLPSVHEQDK
ncbi:hypothetical protein PTSG_05630 [Salpingoeca rosetta]|uniref:Uncharacterized protein n=1 Tax=Salpingoeca rosetta (strain ATCC 50818 / BSB-021) TaxID=946362 RepID=F2UBS0_SALR5|nr:uncharacterized protein PTSG_05630 [Salpingoeca rosetta]EGD73936.1 hypothetical protein PTSG_05630 [Salpingoeca rosetta]|eukprot:XP_004993499.1 hypothetical protein PTSG_05630 [Salpingoeca rosetta]